MMKSMSAVVQLHPEVADVIEESALQAWFIESTNNLVERVNRFEIAPMMPVGDVRRLSGEVLEAIEGMIRVADELESRLTE